MCEDVGQLRYAVYVLQPRGTQPASRPRELRYFPGVTLGGVSVHLATPTEGVGYRCEARTHILGAEPITQWCFSNSRSERPTVLLGTAGIGQLTVHWSTQRPKKRVSDPNHALKRRLPLIPTFGISSFGPRQQAGVLRWETGHLMRLARRYLQPLKASGGAIKKEPAVASPPTAFSFEKNA